MPLINGHDLIESGWQPGPGFTEALAAAHAYERRGITDVSYILKLVARDHPKGVEKLKPRETAVPLAEAIEATSKDDEKNIGAVRRYMNELLKMPVISSGAVMPDACPAGSAPATIPVGGAIAVENAIIPSAHSADICCSMFATFFQATTSVETMLDDLMHSTRFGFGGRKPEDRVHHPVLDEEVWGNPFLNDLKHYAEMHMADQGDGNHFAYIGKVSLGVEEIRTLQHAGHTDIAEPLDRESGKRSDFHVLVTHHGSRGLGAQVYKRGQRVALKQTAKTAEGIPKAASWIDFDTGEGKDYWEALQYVSRWTRGNHESIHARFLDRNGGNQVTAFGNEHNFVWKRGNQFLHGKGATPAWKDDDGRPLLGLIPLNMASPILMVLGRDNEDFLSFCPHGAGRNQSRTATMRPFKKEDGTLDEQRIQHVIDSATEGLDIRWFYGKPDLSESPIGYKSAEQVKNQIESFGLADIVAEIEPLGCIMAGDSGPKPWEREKELSPKQIRQIQHRADRRKDHQDLKNWKTEDDEDGLD